MAKKVFIFSFVIACVLQGFIFIKFSMADFNMWARQGEYIQTGNPIQFDFLQAYGHPGGPLIEGVVFIREIFGFSYQNSLMTLMIILGGLAVAGASVISYLLTKNNWWWPIVLVVLSTNWLYVCSTPPSTVVSLYIPFLFLFSLYIYKKEEIKNSFLVWWSLLAGFTMATRVDIGGFMIICFLICLKPKISWRQALWLSLGAGASFVLFDPYMWFMPIQHLGDLLFKIIYHYDEFVPSKISLSSVLTFSIFSLVSMFFAFVFLFIEKKSLIPKRFIYVFLIATLILYTIFLSANYQAPRYFIPIINIWQMILPSFVFSLTSNLKPSLERTVNIFLIVILILFPISFLISSLLINDLYI